MIGSIKYKLRHLKAQGRFSRIIGLMIHANSHFKSIKQFRLRKDAINSLHKDQYGESVQSWIDFIWATANGFFRPIQQLNELKSLIDLISERKPKTVLEIGTANGGTLFLFCQASDDYATIVSIDLPGGINGGGYPLWKTPLYKKFAKKSQHLHLLRCNSHAESTVEEVKKKSPSNKFDVIMIDADHSYNGVKKDFELYSPLVNKNGIVVLHDIIANRFDPSIKVDQFWQEIKNNYVTQEIVFDRSQGNMGIGIVFF